MRPRIVPHVKLRAIKNTADVKRVFALKQTRMVVLRILAVGY